MTNTRPNVALDGRYSMVETAALLGVDRRTIYRWRKSGYLKQKRRRFNNRPFITGREIIKIFEVCN